MLALLTLVFNVFNVLTVFILVPLYKISAANHLMVILLSLEVLSLVTIAAFTMFLFSAGMCTPFILTSFAIFVCEACLGLGVLINSSRMLGSDHISILF